MTGTDAETFEVGEPGKEDPFLPGVVKQQFKGEGFTRRFTDQLAVTQDVSRLLQQARRFLQALAQGPFNRRPGPFENDGLQLVLPGLEEGAFPSCRGTSCPEHGVVEEACRPRVLTVEEVLVDPVEIKGEPQGVAYPDIVERDPSVVPRGGVKALTGDRSSRRP